MKIEEQQAVLLKKTTTHSLTRGGLPSLRSDSTNGIQVKTKPNYIVKMKNTNLIRTVYSVILCFDNDSEF